MSNPKRHHYLPVSYLNRFTTEGTEQGKLWVYDIKQRQFRIQTPHNTGVQSYYNAVLQDDGTRNYEIEKSFSQIEGDARAVIHKIEEREQIDERDRGVLSLFVAAQNLRVPEFEDEVAKTIEGPLRMAGQMSFATLERAKDTLAKFEKDTGAPLGATAEQMMEYFQRDTYTLEFHRNESLRMMVNLMGDMAKHFARMDWMFFHAPKDRTFITTDSPFCVMQPTDWNDMPKWYGYGYGTLGTRKIMPLSAKICLIMFDPGTHTEHFDGTEAGVRAINLHLAAEAYRFVIARNEGLIRSLVRAVERAERRRGFKWGGSKLRVS